MHRFAGSAAFDAMLPRPYLVSKVTWGRLVGEVAWVVRHWGIRGRDHMAGEAAGKRRPGEMGVGREGEGSAASPPRNLDRRVALRLLALARPHAGRLLQAGVCLLLSSAGFLAVPYVIRVMTDSVFVHHDVAALDRVTLLLCVVVLVTAGFGYGRGYL